MSEAELLKILKKEKSYTEEDLLLFIHDLRKENQNLKGTIETYDILLKSNVKGTKVIEKLEKWLEEQKVECNNYSKYIEKKVSELRARSSGKTYIASEIMKNEVAKKNWQEVLDKLKQLQEEE